MLPDLVSLALFVRVAETRSITKAAVASHIALAAASRRISLLVHHCGVKLLIRTARGADFGRVRAASEAPQGEPFHASA